jgi:hypothetical protein
MTTISMRLTALAVAVLICGVGGHAAAGPPPLVELRHPSQTNTVDVTGVWIFTVDSPAGKSNPTLTFKQEGEKLTGQYSSQLMGQADLTGTVKGQAIEFVVSATVQGTAIELKYAGSVDSKDSMKGTLSAGDFGGGTFTAARKQN